MAHLAKGVWFVTAKRVLEARTTIDALDAHLQPKHRAILHDPIASEWYPEEALAECLQGLRDVVAGGNAERFERLLEEASESGIHRFFTAILKLSTPGFMLGRIPTLWKILRRGPSSVTVERTPEGSHIRYAGFPFYDDENYRILARASIRVLVRLTGREPEVRLEDWTRETLDVLVVHD